MQLRHLRYFVKIVEAGSFSRAAAVIHVAQPALSQQIAELEAQLGLQLLLRSARGVRPTAAGEVLYREASSILRQMDQLPGIVRSSAGEVEGVVSLGMSSTLAATVAGRFIETCRTTLPKVTLKFSVSDSETLKARLEARTLDLALVFEDELVPAFRRTPLFRQRLYLIGRPPVAGNASSVSLAELAALPLILPSLPNVVRSVLDRAFAAAGISATVVAEADVLSSILSAVLSGVGQTVLPKGDLSDLPDSGLAKPVLVEPPLFLTASVLSSGDFPLTHAGEAVRRVLGEFAVDHLRTAQEGAEWIEQDQL
ncbi:LysR substrate-binding domain-containing protein [Sinorhizobium sp. BG8]|uniref:LysR substrate-binding domain-containing protein n=1 Tax=Sinorhizobium sp. BG8 TaxID=2613773 RepID=UPI00193EAAE4|nr:LysR substrate-binding domain-containing protein [Sinorhizobium sp. BG8]QRM56142.1 LysR family transcriptional regulator [Sinorhizobium sp. BG8]